MGSSGSGGAPQMAEEGGRDGVVYWNYNIAQENARRKSSLFNVNDDWATVNHKEKARLGREFDNQVGLDMQYGEEAKRQQEEIARIEAENQAALDKITNEIASSKGKVTRDETKTMQRERASSFKGRRGTILTSPLGGTEGSNTTQKTLLGA